MPAWIIWAVGAIGLAIALLAIAVADRKSKREIARRKR